MSSHEASATSAQTLQNSATVFFSHFLSFFPSTYTYLLADYFLCASHKHFLAQNNKEIHLPRTIKTFLVIRY